MIQMDVKAAIMLFVTLALGVALGALGAGALSRQRYAEVRDLRRPPGFVAHMEEVIGPRDSAQRAGVDRILAATAARNDTIVQGANEQLRAALDSMKTRLSPLLDANQRARLDEAARFAPPLRVGADGRGGPPPGGRRGGGPGGREGPGGPPPDERRGGPPPDGRGPGGPPRP